VSWDVLLRESNEKDEKDGSFQENLGDKKFV
jgi:hypothetical protein